MSFLKKVEGSLGSRASGYVKDLASKIRLVKTKKDIDELTELIDANAQDGKITFKDAKGLMTSLDRKQDQLGL